MEGVGRDVLGAAWRETADGIDGEPTCRRTIADGCSYEVGDRDVDCTPSLWTGLGQVARTSEQCRRVY